MNLTKYFLLVILVFCCSNAKKLPERFNAKVIGIKDGDTIVVLKEKQQIVVRLSDIDCPERSQPFGSVARKFTSDFCFGKEVTIVSKGKLDRYKRLVATVMCNGQSLNYQLVANGMAWHFKKYSTNKELATLEQKARKNKVGLWSDKYPVAPWTWRKPKRNAKTANVY